ncbi:MAG: hypothetical protein JWQ33_248, partial [Ramlibacter sp.]|nr:hypothetical protein [Ramlibacter sp.]
MNNDRVAPALVAGNLRPLAG